MIWFGYSRLSLVIRSVHTLGMDWLNDIVGIWQVVTAYQVCSICGLVNLFTTVAAENSLTFLVVSEICLT